MEDTAHQVGRPAIGRRLQCCPDGIAIGFGEVLDESGAAQFLADMVGHQTADDADPPVIGLRHIFEQVQPTDRRTRKLHRIDGCRQAIDAEPPPHVEAVGQQRVLVDPLERNPDMLARKRPKRAERVDAHRHAPYPLKSDVDCGELSRPRPWHRGSVRNGARQPSIFRAAMKADCGISTWPN
jgi:hypothetical protein